MNLTVALRIFYLGVRLGLDLSPLGFKPESMMPDDVFETMRIGFEPHREKVEELAKQLLEAQDRLDWWVCHSTAKNIYRYGLIEGFDQFSKSPPDKDGTRILDEYTIDKLTQKVFAQSKSYDEALGGE